MPRSIFSLFFKNYSNWAKTTLVAKKQFQHSYKKPAHNSFLEMIAALACHEKQPSREPLISCFSSIRCIFAAKPVLSASSHNHHDLFWEPGSNHNTVHFILTWRGRQLDQQGVSSRVRPFHCRPVGLTPAITTNVGNSTVQFLVVGTCVRASPLLNQLIQSTPLISWLTDVRLIQPLANH